MNTSRLPALEANLAPRPEVPHFHWMLIRAGMIVVLTAGCVTVVATAWVSPVRVVLAIGFLLFCPGLGLAEVLEIHDLAQRLAIAIAVSLALDTLLALLLFYAGAFSVLLTVSILAAVTLTALAAGLVRALSRPRMTRAQEPA